MVFKHVIDLIKGREVVSLSPTDTVRVAIDRMVACRVDAILVLDHSLLIGLFTGRDLLVRVVAKGLSPDEVLLREVMTTDPISVKWNRPLIHCLKLMFTHHFRHLPIIREGHALGILTCRDLPADFSTLCRDWKEAEKDAKGEKETKAEKETKPQKEARVPREPKLPKDPKPRKVAKPQKEGKALK